MFWEKFNGPKIFFSKIAFCNRTIYARLPFVACQVEYISFPRILVSWSEDPKSYFISLIARKLRRKSIIDRLLFILSPILHDAVISNRYSKTKNGEKTHKKTVSKIETVKNTHFTVAKCDGMVMNETQRFGKRKFRLLMQCFSLQID